MSKQSKNIKPLVPELNAGLYLMVRRTYQLLSDVYDYSETPEGAALNQHEYVASIDTALSHVIRQFLDAIGLEIGEYAEFSIKGSESFAQRKNHVIFVEDEQPGE